jgi:AcrB/AcrD/AcrF family protein/outer membrane efflux protein
VLALEQAISLAQSNNRQLKITRQSVPSAKDQILAARAQRYPQFNVQFTGAHYAMGTPFGFMTFLGIASLIGVIVSHVIVLFDFIEEMHEKGEPLEQALLDAGIVRLRPVMITAP